MDNIASSIRKNTVLVCYFTCSTFQIKVGSNFTEEGYMETEDKLPADAKCVFNGAATPATGKGPAICLDPVTIFYGNSSCNVTSKLSIKQCTKEIVFYMLCSHD